MPHLEIQAAGLAETEVRDLPSGTALLVGRSPEAGRVAGAPADSIPVAIRSQSVSSNHLLAWRTEEATFLRDLGSRNGSWLRLPRDAIVRVEPATAPLRVQLAATPTTAASAVNEPAEAEWTGRADYARTVAAAVTRWSELQGLKLAVALVGQRPTSDAGGYAGHLPLADGTALEVGAGRTLDDRSHALFAVLWRYVTRQNALFTAEEESRAEGLVLASAAIRKAHRQVYEAAARGARALLLLGPTGAGKEGLARCFHRYTGRSGAFIARNCAMFSKDMMRAELFGAEAGAFTGATHRIVGAVERAQGGTLFLDEIGELGGDVQPTLLRFLDSGEYEPLGKYGHPHNADVRVVAATNRDLRAATRAGEFRADLWYRLSVQVVEVPPLRERLDDLVTFLELRRLPGGVAVWEALTPDAQRLLRAQPWDGNFRELMNFVEHLPIGAGAGSIDAATCHEVLRQVSLGAPAAMELAPEVPVPVGDEAWGQLAVASLGAYREDLGKQPETWDEVKIYLEKYLKPLLFAHLGGIVDDRELARGAIAILTRRLQTDRNTVAKQLTRYQERFAGSDDRS